MDDRRQAALDLLASRHAFPGPFEFRVVVRTDAVAPVVSALAAALQQPDATVAERPSRGGRWVAVHYTAQVASAERVLEIYELVRGLDGVVLAL